MGVGLGWIGENGEMVGGKEGRKGKCPVFDGGGERLLREACGSWGTTDSCREGGERREWKREMESGS